MINLLRLVDFLNSTFPDPRPIWMIPIVNHLANSQTSLAERVLLIKLLLNRPNIFNQPAIWAKHLLYYLSLEKNGAKFIHYFYRDTLKRYLIFYPNLDQKSI